MVNCGGDRYTLRERRGQSALHTWDQTVIIVLFQRPGVIVDEFDTEVGHQEDWLYRELAAQAHQCGAVVGVPFLV